MENKEFKKLHDQILTDEKYPQEQKIERGLLYRAIQKTLRDDQSQTAEICNYFGVRNDAERSADQGVLVDQLFAFPVFAFDGVIRAAIKKFLEILSREQGIMDWLIIVGACALVGLYFSYVRPQQAQVKKIQQSVAENKSEASPPSPRPAALCLVVPANIAISFSVGSTINTDQLTYLIDNASYLCCTNLKEADLNENQLATTNEVIPTDSEQEVYVRVEIDNGQDIIGNTIPYTLKTNLPSHAQCKIKQLACLMNLSGLETFTCI